MQFVRIQIHLQRSSRALRLRIPVASFRVLPWFKRFIQVGLALLILQIGTIYTHDYLIEEATQHQAKLFRKLQKSELRLAELDSSMRQTFLQEDLAYLKFGVKPPDPEERLMGIGGDLPPESTLVFSVHPVRSLRHRLEQKIDNLGGQINRSTKSFADIHNYMEQQFAQFRQIPTVSPANGRFSSGFGTRIHPVTGERDKMHYGVDISNSRWTPIYATADGKVELVKYQEYFGNYVTVRHTNGYETKYGHMEKPMVKPGQLVKRFQLLGYMGRTGRTSGYHVHYEVWRQNQAVNPMHYILSPEYSVE